jgi:hypothetical protein
MSSLEIGSRQSVTAGKATAVSKADKERKRLRETHPKAWTLGERAGLLKLPTPKEFLIWTNGERDAFFTAAHLVYLIRHKKSGAQR